MKPKKEKGEKNEKPDQGADCQNPNMVPQLYGNQNKEQMQIEQKEKKLASR